MGRVSKFVGLTKYFQELKEYKIDLTFQDIEHIVGEPLCLSAYSYEPYWSLSKTHIMPRSWIENGYKTFNLNLKNQTVSFRRIDETGTTITVDKRVNRKNLENNVNQKSSISTLNCETLIANIDRFYSSLKDDVNSRYLSWEHCYIQFNKFKDKVNLSEKEIDYLSLHLAFYLSSWGMYRGSSFLLKKDYKVHIDIVKELYKSEYKVLWAIRCEDLKKDANLDLLFKLSNNLKTIHIENRKNLDNYNNVSPILITKVLLGTLGCVPAYDRFLKTALVKYKLASGNYNKDSIRALTEYYEMNKEKLEICRIRISDGGINYPQMKLLDMGLWQIGYDLWGAKKNERVDI